MDETQRSKKPSPAFEIRLVGHGIRPWAVPMRSLARLLNAVQRLIDPRDDADLDSASESNEPQADASKILNLLDVTSGSASYPVSAQDSEGAQTALRLIGEHISNPNQAEWNDSALSSLRDFSDVAKSLGCHVEFCTPRQKRTKGTVIARISPITYDEVEGSAFIHGGTSVYARIERVGGATDMHCGIRLPRAPRRMVICRVVSEDLVRELGQYMYQYAMLAGEATWLRSNWRLKHLVIKSVEPPKDGSFVEALRRVHSAGGSAWDEISDPDAFICEMRN